MKKPASTGVRIVLDLAALTPQAREDLTNNVLTMGATGSLGTVQAVKDALADLGKTRDAVTAARKVTVNTAATHKLAVEAEATALVGNNKSFNLLRTLVENGSVTPADVKSMGFVPYEGRPPKPALLPPVQLDVVLGKPGLGKAKVTVYETGTPQHYAAESSVDGTTWVELVGGGKSRHVTGKPGTSLQVRFALRRGQNQSAWSNPATVIFP